jgi:hypothetical protein
MKPCPICYKNEIPDFAEVCDECLEAAKTEEGRIDRIMEESEIEWVDE